VIPLLTDWFSPERCGHGTFRRLRSSWSLYLASGRRQWSSARHLLCLVVNDCPEDLKIVWAINSHKSRALECYRSLKKLLMKALAIYLWKSLQNSIMEIILSFSAEPNVPSKDYILGPFTRHKNPQIRSRSHPDRVENVRVKGTHKTDPTSMWDQSGCLLHPSKCVGSIWSDLDLIWIWSGFLPCKRDTSAMCPDWTQVTILSMRVTTSWRLRSNTSTVLDLY
jgi:hypothetical protein